MRYSTTEFLRDSSWFINFLLNKVENFYPKFKKTLYLAAEFEWDTFIFRIFENLPQAIVIVFLGLLMVFILTKYTESQNGVRITTITTTSMNSAIKPGSIVVTFPSKIFKVGDIVSYKEKHPLTGFATGRIITHRIISVKNDNTFITKGDANNYPDPGEITKKNILGKVLIVLPYLGFFNVILKTIPGFLIFIAVPAALVVKNEFEFIKKEVNLKKIDLSRI